jgi:hypothetical protein
VLLGLGFVDLEAYTATKRPIPQAITDKPLSLTRQTNSVLRSFDGTSTTTVDTTKMERDSKGRIRIDFVREINGERFVPDAIITDPVKQEYFVINSIRRLVTIVHPPSAASVSQPESAREAQVQGRQTLPSKTILGIAVDGTRTVTTGKKVISRDGKLADIQLTINRWRSRELGVELESEWTYAGMGKIVMKTIQIDQKEPDASLFELPKDYTVIDAEGKSSN